MFKFLNKLALVGLLVVVAVVGRPNLATAQTFGIEIELNGQVVFSGNNTMGTGTVSTSTATGTFFNLGGSNNILEFFGTVTYNGQTYNIATTETSSNAPGTSSSAYITQTNTTISGVAGDSSGNTLTIINSQNGFNSPLSNPYPDLLSISSSVTGTGNTGVNGVTFAGYAANNVLVPTLYSGVGGTPSVSGSFATVTDGSVGSGPNTTALDSSLTGPTFELTVSNQYTGLSATTSFSNTTTLDVTPTPVPAGVLLAVSGMPVLSVGYWLRRRQVRLQAAA